MTQWTEPGEPCTWPADHWQSERGRAAWSEGFCPGGCATPMTEPGVCCQPFTHGCRENPMRILWTMEPDGAVTFRIQWPVIGEVSADGTPS